MPAVSERQRRFMMAELARAKAGKRTRTGMSIEQLEDFKTMKHGKHPKSYMPHGASLSPSGDIGMKRCMEARKVVPIKGMGPMYRSGFKSLGASR